MVLHAFKIAADVPHRTFKKLRRIQDVNLQGLKWPLAKNSEQHVSLEEFRNRRKVFCFGARYKTYEALKV